MNLPNKITLSRICLIPVFAVLFCLDGILPYNFLIAGIVFCIAACTDFLDGYIARKRHLVTNLGKFLDPIADKVLVLSALVVLLTRPNVFIANLGSWALIVAGCGVAIILAREIFVSGFRMVAASSGTVIAADMFGKYKTTAQDVSIVILIVYAGIAELTDHIAGQIINYIGLAFFAIAIVLTVVSGINYLVKNREVLKK